MFKLNVISKERKVLIEYNALNIIIMLYYYIKIS